MWSSYWRCASQAGLVNARWRWTHESYRRHSADRTLELPRRRPADLIHPPKLENAGGGNFASDLSGHDVGHRIRLRTSESGSIVPAALGVEDPPRPGCATRAPRWPSQERRKSDHYAGCKLRPDQAGPGSSCQKVNGEWSLGQPNCSWGQSTGKHGAISPTHQELCRGS